MTKVHVQFSDADETKIIGHFAGPQPEESFTNQGEVDENDPRLLAFLSPLRRVRQFAPLEFLDLFTNAEQEAVAGAAMSNVQAKLWWDRMLAASFISIDDERTRDGIGALVSLGLITAAREAAVVSAMSAQ